MWASGIRDVPMAPGQQIRVSKYAIPDVRRLLNNSEIMMINPGLKLGEVYHTIGGPRVGETIALATAQD
jgi:hypothetical protein